MNRLFALVLTASVLIIITAAVLDRHSIYILRAFITALASILVLLVQTFKLYTKRDQAVSASEQYLACVHLALHIVPVCFIGILLFGKPTPVTSCLFIIPLSLFFYTGYRTWKMLYLRYRAKMYRIFYFGNAWMLIWSPILFIVGQPFDGVADRYYLRLQVFYFSIHFLITGAAVLKVDSDFGKDRS